MLSREDYDRIVKWTEQGEKIINVTHSKCCKETARDIFELLKKYLINSIGIEPDGQLDEKRFKEFIQPTEGYEDTTQKD